MGSVWDEEAEKLEVRQMRFDPANSVRVAAISPSADWIPDVQCYGSRKERL